MLFVTVERSNMHVAPCQILTRARISPVRSPLRPPLSVSQFNRQHLPTCVATITVKNPKPQPPKSSPVKVFLVTVSPCRFLSMALVLSQNLRAFVSRTSLLLLCFFFTTHVSSPSFNLITTGNVSITTHISSPFLGYTLRTLCLPVLFYLLADTASRYFCPSVQRLSKELRLSPTTSGATLLSLGNGSPDVLASIASFGSGSGEVGWSSVLGGTFFVACVVTGMIDVCASTTSRSLACVDRNSFIHDACFFLLVLSSLVVILVVGMINVLGAVAFTSLYLVYALVVSVVRFRCVSSKHGKLVAPILDEEDDEKPVTKSKEASQGDKEDDPSRYGVKKLKSMASFYIRWFFALIGMPLHLLRRLTIPDASEERGSKPFAVTSATFSPFLITVPWHSKRGTNMASSTKTMEESPPMYLAHALLSGILLGALELKTTSKDWAPRKGPRLFPWLAMGFLMSVLWTCVIAEELVGLLVSLGFVLGISPSILGLTVLAWGNSIGDLTANAAMAANGGQDGAQIAMSGCYAGPIFNTLAGLGSSLVVSAWSAHPRPFAIPVVGPTIFDFLGFMIGGLVWALVVLPKREMKLDRVLEVGLLAIFSCFLSLRLSQSLGLVKL